MDTIEREAAETLLLRYLSERIESKLRPIETGNDDHQNVLKDLKVQIDSIESTGKEIEEKLKQPAVVSSATTDSTQTSPAKAKVTGKRSTTRDFARMDGLKVKDDDHKQSDVLNNLISPKVGAESRMKRASSAGTLGNPTGLGKGTTKADLKEKLVTSSRGAAKKKDMEPIAEEDGKKFLIKPLVLAKKSEDKKEATKPAKSVTAKGKKGISKDDSNRSLGEEKTDDLGAKDDKKDKRSKTVKNEKKETKKGGKSQVEKEELPKPRASTSRAEGERPGKPTKKKDGDPKEEVKKPEKKVDTKKQEKTEKKTEDKKKDEKPVKKGGKDEAKKDNKKADKKKKDGENKADDKKAEENKLDESKIEEPKPAENKPEEPKPIVEAIIEEKKEVVAIEESTIVDSKIEPEVKTNLPDESSVSVTTLSGDENLVFEALNKIIGRNVRDKISGSKSLGKYIREKIESYEIKVANLSYENEQLKSNLTEENLEKKVYAMKSATKEIVEFNEIEWVTELFDKTEPTEDLFWIIELFLTILEDNEIPSRKDTKAFWEFASQYFKSKLDNLNDILMGISEKVDTLSMSKKLKLKKLIKGKTSVLNPNTFDSVPFCMVISILSKEICEHLGILTNDTAKKNNPGHIYYFNKERCDVYNQRVIDLQQLIKQYHLNTE